MFNKKELIVAARGNSKNIELYKIINNMDETQNITDSYLLNPDKIKESARDFYANKKVTIEACQIGSTYGGWPSVLIEINSSQIPILRVSDNIFPLMDYITRDVIISTIDNLYKSRGNYEGDSHRIEILDKLNKVFDVYESEFKN